MFTFLKAQTASLIASAIDFLVTIVAVELAGWWYMAATAMGTVTGGLTHFLLGRKWVFAAGAGKVPTQLLKYFIVWNGSFLLNTAGVYVLTQFAGLTYIISKVATAVAVGFFYNYTIQKSYVFK
ncbi:GtrA family protein [Pontibacter qinzhouensis]|uniref:GtrA family protein n=1 Tax=Pontibacter qinzhouensis TaxID=2603253 RepID=A0A5C8JKX3_9BACT|nr:GtrA family protein [Pontibacter qinzhouensis]TXK37334.1 GtrA family protein [Pontibacter qinzhouensis]